MKKILTLKDLVELTIEAAYCFPGGGDIFFVLTDSRIVRCEPFGD